MIASLLDVYDFQFEVITDNPLPEIDSRILWHQGLSYEILGQYASDSIDLCIIDTDHNYWTLGKELSVLCNRIKEGGFIAMHDVETFYHDTGMALSYWDGKPYPIEEIEKEAPNGSLGDALIDFLHIKKLTYRMYAWNHESNGAALIQNNPQAMFALVTPGPQSIFAKNEDIKEPMPCK